LRASELKEKLSSLGYTVIESEELKIVLSANEYGYTGTEISEYLQKNGAVAEFFDDEYLVFMLTPENTDEELSRLFGLLSALPKRVPIAKEAETQLPRPISEMSIREAVLSKCETVLAKDAVGRVCASPTVSCPPAVPIAVSGELITEETVSLFKKYHINEIEVVKK
jgi:arginine/lysine/ornithine decarboxylase